MRGDSSVGQSVHVAEVDRSGVDASSRAISSELVIDCMLDIFFDVVLGLWFSSICACSELNLVSSLGLVLDGAS